MDNGTIDEVRAWLRESERILWERHRPFVEQLLTYGHAAMMIDDQGGNPVDLLNVILHAEQDGAEH